MPGVTKVAAKAASLHIIADEVRFNLNELFKLIRLEVDKLLIQSNEEGELR